jgi:seryl-tRNA synthetase
LSDILRIEIGLNSKRKISKIIEFQILIILLIFLFEFKPISHYEIGKRLNLMDFNVATKTSGSRFVFLKGERALLERAISNFMLDCHTKEFGYQEISPQTQI